MSRSIRVSVRIFQKAIGAGLLGSKLVEMRDSIAWYVSYFCSALLHILQYILELHLLRE